jgi:Skp family chaperone for outer membrane proteins
MRRGRALFVAAALALAAGAAPAQDPPAGPATAILTLDQDRLFAASAFGRQSLASVEAEAQALQAENRGIEAALEAEERQLTERRAAMAPEEFRAAADAFDEKVKGIRAAQTAKARDLAQQRDLARQRFFEAAAPVLAGLMTERGAVAILDRSAIILSFDRVDITDLAIERVDAVLAGAAGQAAPEAAPDPGGAVPPGEAPAAGPPAGTDQASP